MTARPRKAQVKGTDGLRLLIDASCAPSSGDDSFASKWTEACVERHLNIPVRHQRAPIDGLCVWQTESDHSLLLPFVVVVCCAQYFLGELFSPSLSGSVALDPSVPARYRRVCQLIRRWSDCIARPQGPDWPFTFKVTGATSCSKQTPGINLTVVLLDIDKELLKFQRHRAQRHHQNEGDMPPLSLALDEAIAFLAYDQRVSVVQLKSKNNSALIAYLCSFSKCLLKKHTDIFPSHDGSDFTVSRRLKIHQPAGNGAAGADNTEMRQVWAHMLQVVPMVSAQRGSDLVSLFDRPHALHSAVQPSRSGESRLDDEQLDSTVTEMIAKAKINKKLAATLCNIFRSMDPEEQISSNGK